MRRLAAATVLILLFTNPAFALGKHVILLIDDSGDMRGWRDDLERKVPAWIFRGAQPADPAAPRFDPATDTLSVLYFSLRELGAPDSCKSVRGDVITPASVLNLEPIAAPDEASFRRNLRDSLNKPCRFQGHLSPIVTSVSFALPYIQKLIPANALFSRVLVATASNEAYNFTAATTAGELSHLANDFPQFDVRVPKGTADLAEEVARAYSFDTQREWNDDRGGIRYRVFEARPRGRTPDASIIFNRRIQLDRVAASSDRVFGIPKIPGAGDIRIPAGDVIPLTLDWQFPEAGVRGAVDLLRCELPVCVSDGDGIRVDLFHPSVNPIAQSRAEAPFGAQPVLFRVGFRPAAHDVYDHLDLKSSLQRVELTATPPASAWLTVFPLRLDNALLTRLWFRRDGVPPGGGLTHDEAEERLRALNFGAWCATILLLLFLIARAARRSRVFTFEPQIEWSPAGEIVIDFDRPGHSRVLAGSLVVRNRGKVGWLGRRLGGVEQPTRTASVSIDPSAPAIFARAGFELTADVALGFFDNAQRLVGNVRDAVSEGRQINVFVAESAFADFRPDRGIEEHVVSLQIPVSLSFMPHDVASLRYANVNGEIAIDVRVKPESERAPFVTYHRENRQHRYAHNARLQVGRLEFESRARHRFARPFVSTYSIATSCEGRPLPGHPLTLAPAAIAIDAYQIAETDVELSCADPEVANPEPVSDRYAFVLVGEQERGYGTNDLAFDLYRDPTKAELELYLTYLSKRVEVHWDGQRKAWGFRAIDDVNVSTDGKAVRFAASSHFAFESDVATQVAIGIDAGNSAKSGKGSVTVNLDSALRLAPDAAGMLHMRHGWGANDVLEIPSRSLVIPEGNPPLHADIYLRSTPIASIDGGEIAAEMCVARISFTIEIRDDAGHFEKRALEVTFPLHLEQLPGVNVVVVDFGTSSVAAAVGTAGERNDDPLIDLQHIKVYQNESIASADVEGPEAGTPFLPSGIVCDADDRQVATGYGRSLPPGFPGHTGATGASLAPSSPSFITLPVRRLDLVERPGRVLLSLKSWLGMNARYVPLPSGQVTFLDGTEMRTESSLPLDDLLESSYAALAQGYLKFHGPLGAGRVVVCHPNTFSELHRERLRNVAWKALAGPLEIIATKYLHLMSESDAVAYAYCADRMRETKPQGTQRVFVYDLGAGTLDVSVITIEWSPDPVYPIFVSRHHLGVPIAGNYFDETLARIIHRLLSDKEVLGNGALKYQYPIVTRTKISEEHAQASRAAWNDIRRAKQTWEKGKDFAVVVGNVFSKSTRGLAKGLVHFEGNESEVPTEMDGRAGVIRQATPDGQKLVLVIPGAQLAAHPRIVRLVDFVTRDVVREALAVAKIDARDIDTLIVSGRGALWPGLQDRLRQELPNATLASFTSSERMKAAVARGAIAREHFRADTAAIPAGDVSRRLAVVYGQEAGIHAIFEEEWGRPIRIPIAKFRIVDVGLSNPDPARDLGNGSLRRHFYVGVGKHEYTTDQMGGNVLRFTRESGGQILITNERGVQHRIGHRDTVRYASAEWPVGHPFLSPDEELS